MSEMSYMFKLVNQMELAKKARVGMELTYFDVIELLGELNSLYEYIDVLEAEQARWVMVSDRLPKESGWYLAGLIGWAGGSYTGEVHFDTETGLPWRSSVRDEVYCWLDGVPELPKPPEVQQ